jgi:hypothetical protein
VLLNLKIIIAPCNFHYALVSIAHSICVLDEPELPIVFTTPANNCSCVIWELRLDHVCFLAHNGTLLENTMADWGYPVGIHHSIEEDFSLDTGLRLLWEHVALGHLCDWLTLTEVVARSTP